jgi:hypothetical protein
LSSPWSQKDLDENAQLLNIRPKKIDFKMLKDMVRRGSNSVALDFLIQGASYFLRINRTGFLTQVLLPFLFKFLSRIKFQKVLDISFGGLIQS